MATKLIQPFEHGVSWVQDDWMQRASHALIADGKAWLIDATDEPAAIEQVTQRAEIAGVIQLLDRHPRGCVHLAEHYGVSHYKAYRGDVPEDSPFQFEPVLGNKRWRETAIWWPDTGTLVIAEIVGGSQYMALAKGSRVGVHPFVRGLTKVKVGDHLPVQHLLMGHGAPVHDGAAVQLAEAYGRRVRDLPLIPKGLRAFVPGR